MLLALFSDIVVQCLTKYHTLTRSRTDGSVDIEQTMQHVVKA